MLTPMRVNEYRPPDVVVAVAVTSSAVLKIPSRPAPSSETVTPTTPAVSLASRTPLALSSTHTWFPMTTGRATPTSIVLSVVPETRVIRSLRLVIGSMFESVDVVPPLIVTNGVVSSYPVGRVTTTTR